MKIYFRLNFFRPSSVRRPSVVRPSSVRPSVRGAIFDRGARIFLTSKSSSSRFFALDGQIFRSVRPLELIFRFFTVQTSTCGGKAQVTEIPEGAKPPQTPRGQGTGNGDSWGEAPQTPPRGARHITEIPEGGKPPQTPPRHHFKKFALQEQIF